MAVGEKFVSPGSGRGRRFRRIHGQFFLASLMDVFSIFVRAGRLSSMGFPRIAQKHRFVARLSARERRFYAGVFMSRKSWTNEA